MTYTHVHHECDNFYLHRLGSPVGNWLISHWSSASNQVPACVAEPGTPADVGKIVSLRT